MSLFTNPMNIKHIEREFDKNLMPYIWKGGNEKVVWKLCITFHINVGICLYGFEFVLYNLICPMWKGKVALENLYKKYGFLNLYHIIKFKRKYWKQNLSNQIENKIQN
jgi:hypothetical protein